MRKGIVLTALLCLLMTTPVKAAEYPGLLRVTETDNEVIVGADSNGITFRFIDLSEDWYVGDLAAVIFDDNGTEIIFDDTIKDVRYVGFIELYQ